MMWRGTLGCLVLSVFPVLVLAPFSWAVSGPPVYLFRRLLHHSCAPVSVVFLFEFLPRDGPVSLSNG